MVSGLYKYRQGIRDPRSGKICPGSGSKTLEQWNQQKSKCGNRAYAAGTVSYLPEVSGPEQKRLPYIKTSWMVVLVSSPWLDWSYCLFKISIHIKKMFRGLNYWHRHRTEHQRIQDNDIYGTYSPYCIANIIFQGQKVIKKSQNSRNQCFSYYFCLTIEGSGSVSLTNGSGSGRPKNIWILRIRIRNTDSNVFKIR